MQSELILFFPHGMFLLGLHACGRTFFTKKCQPSTLTLVQQKKKGPFLQLSTYCNIFKCFKCPCLFSKLKRFDDGIF